MDLPNPTGQTWYLCLFTDSGEMQAPGYARIPVKFRRDRRGNLVATNRKKPYIFPVSTTSWPDVTGWGVALSQDGESVATGSTKYRCIIPIGVNPCVYPSEVRIVGER